MKDTKGLYLKYFVLKIDGSGPAAMAALHTYAEATDNKTLSRDILKHIIKTNRGA